MKASEILKAVVATVYHLPVTYLSLYTLNVNGSCLYNLNFVITLMIKKIVDTTKFIPVNENDVKVEKQAKSIYGGSFYVS